MSETLMDTWELVCLQPRTRSNTLRINQATSSPCVTVHTWRQRAHVIALAQPALALAPLVLALAAPFRGPAPLQLKPSELQCAHQPLCALPVPWHLARVSQLHSAHPLRRVPPVPSHLE